MKSIIVYKCDTCNREIEVQENKDGLDVVGRCIITNNCRGQLKSIAKKDVSSRLDFPDPDPTGLEDWFQRRLLFTREIKLAQQTWNVVHNFGTIPSVQIFERDDVGNLTEVSQNEIESITFDSPFEVTVKLTRSMKGVIQCIARSTVQPTRESTVVPTLSNTYRQITTTGELTLATLSSASSVPLTIEFYNPETLQPFSPAKQFTINFTTPVSFLSPWKQTNTVYIQGKTYRVRSYNLLNLLTLNDIPDNAPFFFGGFSSTEKYYGLISKAPHTNADSDIEHILDYRDVATNGVGYVRNGIAYVNSDLPVEVFPAIRKLS